MPRRPVAERPPEVLVREAEDGHPEWRDLWNSTLALLKAQGTWKPELRPHLEAYVNYRRLAHSHREEAEREPFRTHPESGRVFAHPGFNLARDCEREARALADLLLLTPASRRAAGLEDDDGGGGDQKGL